MPRNLLVLSQTRALAGALSLALLFAAPSHAAVTIAPGETSATLQAEGCVDASGSIESGVTGECVSGCFTGCDAGQNTTEASLDVSNYSAGSKFVSSTAYTDFTVAAGDFSGNVLDGSIAYDTEWKGGWTLVGAFTGFNAVKSLMTITLFDQSNGGKVVSKSTFHTMTTEGFADINIIDVGFGLDQGTETNSMAVRLVRGHTYRIGLTVRCEGKGAMNADIILDYITNEWGLWWKDLTVSVNADLAEEIAKLRRDLEGHTHTYLTGKGEGHNNTEAETSPAIIMDEDSVTTSDLDLLPDDSKGKDPLPIKSVILKSYPNPFNPSATIAYTIPVECDVTIKAYNMLGQLVRTLVSEHQVAGEYTSTFDATGLSSGVYFYRLIAGEFVETRRMTLMK